jgi:hypothetical protein
MIVSQILTRKAVDKLTSLARGEAQEEPAAVPAAGDEAPVEPDSEAAADAPSAAEETAA